MLREVNLCRELGSNTVNIICCLVKVKLCNLLRCRLIGELGWHHHWVLRPLLSDYITIPHLLLHLDLLLNLLLLLDSHWRLLHHWRLSWDCPLIHIWLISHWSNYRHLTWLLLERFNILSTYHSGSDK